MQAYGGKSRKPCFRAARFLYSFGAIGASSLVTSLRGQSDAVLAHSSTSRIGAGLSAAYHLYTESIKPFFSSSSTIDISTKFSGLGSGVLPLN